MHASMGTRVLEWLVRLLGAMALGGFGGLLLWATSLLLLTPMPGEHPLAILAFKLFVFCILGLTGLAFCGGALLLVIPGAERRLEPTIPEDVQRLCPGCGSKRTNRRSCARCGLPPAAAQCHWLAEDTSPPRPYALLPISLGMFALGVLLLVKMSTRTGDIDRWTSGILLATSLLIVLVGAGGLLAFLVKPKSQPRQHDYVAHVSTAARPPAQHHVVRATLQLRRRTVYRAEGFSLLSYPPAQEPADLDALPEEEALVYRFLAAAALHKHLSVSRTKRIDWSLTPAEDGEGEQLSYRAAPGRDALTHTCATSRAIRVLRNTAVQKPKDEDTSEDAPLRGLLSAIHSVGTVERLLALVRSEDQLRARLQEELFSLSVGLDEQEIHQEAGLLAAPVET